jgi:N-acetyl-anhydromuramyl-L-alanine amidase AmpD
MTREQQPPPRPAPLPTPLPRIAASSAPLVVKFRPASHKNYSQSARPAPRLIVLHCTDGCEGACKDDDVAAMFADDNLQPRRSAHYVVDSDSVTRCVPDTFAAWHCGRTGNARSIGIELCGRAAQSRAEWLDALSLPMLCRCARLLAVLTERHKIPVRFVSSAGLIAGDSGITTHACVSAAWGESTHTDPGPGFPLSELLAAVERAVAVPPSV